MSQRLRTFRLRFKIAGMLFTRHVRAEDTEHARDQARVIESVLRNAGLSAKEIILLSYAVEDFCEDG